MAAEVNLPQSRVPAPRETKRTEAVVTEQNLEKQRQAMLNSKNTEISSLANAGDEHRSQVDDFMAQRKVILDQMRAVRSKMHSKLRSARGKGRNDSGEANRALARAGKHALDKHMEADQWIAHADAQEERSRAVIVAANASSARVQEVCSARTSEAQMHSSQRIAFGQAMTNEHASNHEAFRERHSDHCLAKERDAHSVAQLRSGAARRGQEEAAWQVRKAMDDSVKVQNSSVQLIQSSQKAAENKVATAQRELKEKQRECEAAIDREMICHAQSRNIAAEMMKQDDIVRDDELGKLERKLAQVNTHMNNTVSVGEEEEAPAAELNVSWDKLNNQSLEKARSHAAVQEAKAEQRVNEAKVLMAQLQADCAAYIRELNDQWEAAKRVDAQKIAAAQRRTDDLVQKCSDTVQSNNLQCLEIISTTEDFANVTKAQLQDRHSSVDDLATQRVSMMQNQSRERRQHAEQRLAGLRKHTKEVQAACEDRVREEEGTASEKMRIARTRFEENVQRAQQRKHEAQSRRDSALDAYEAVMARCRGATMEARRRGLTNIAEILEPPRAQHQPPVQAPSPSQPSPPAGDPLCIESAVRGEPISPDSVGNCDSASDAKGFDATSSTMALGIGDWNQDEQSTRPGTTATVDGQSTRPGTRGTTGSGTRPGTGAV